MFVLTMKFNKKLAIMIIASAAVILAAIVIIAASSGSGDTDPVRLGLGIGVKTNDDRLKYLADLGWECDQAAIEEQEIVIPRQFSKVFEEYNDLQKKQGFDLNEFKGLGATMYRYKVKNYPSGEENVLAQIIVQNYQVIAGDIHSTSVDGFMHGIK